jgi:hypothetical protein
MTRGSVDATDTPVVETGAAVAWTGGVVVKTDARVINARAVDTETGARIATTGPSVSMMGPSVTTTRRGKSRLQALQNAASKTTSPTTPTWYADTRRSKKFVTS